LTDVASMVFWVFPEDIHGGSAAKAVFLKISQTPNPPILGDDEWPILDSHWYYVKVVWDTDKPGGIPGNPFVPAGTSPFFFLFQRGLQVYLSSYVGKEGSIRERS